MAQALDVDRLELEGDAFPVADQVGMSITLPLATVSATGALAFRRGGTSGNTNMAWFDRGGKSLGSVGEASLYGELALSPDGRQIAAARSDSPGTTIRDVWLVDAERGVPTRFTFDPANEVNPTWSPDGSTITYACARNGVLDIYRKSASGTQPEELLLKSDLDKHPSDWSSDGKHLLYAVVDSKTKNDLWILPEPRMGGAPRPFLATPYNESQGQFSPVAGSSRWIAYTSDESGRMEVYVQPFTEEPAGASGKFQISSQGGSQPRWRRDGKYLYYVASDGKLMEVEVKTAPRFEHGIPQPLFQTRVLTSLQLLRHYFRYSVSPDGKRFLVLALQTETTSLPITVVLNWTAGLKR